MDTLKKLKTEHKAAMAAATTTIAMASTPVFATDPLADLATAGTSISSLVGTIGGAAVLATGISVGLVMFRRATGR